MHMIAAIREVNGQAGYPIDAHREALIPLCQIGRLANVQHVHKLRHHVGHAAIKFQLYRQSDGLLPAGVHIRQVQIASFACREECGLYVKALAASTGAADNLVVRNPAHILCNLLLLLLLPSSSSSSSHLFACASASMGCICEVGNRHTLF